MSYEDRVSESARCGDKGVSISRLKKRKELRNYPTNSAIVAIIRINLCQVANRVCLGCVLGRL